jgi:uncharacterized protein (DUF4415 family)
MAKTTKTVEHGSKARTSAAAKSRGRSASSKTHSNPRMQVDPGQSGWATDLVFDVREPKLAVSLRLDADVLRFFRGFGAGYQTRINEVLKAFMHARGGVENGGAHAIPPSRLPRASIGHSASKRAR